MPIYRDKRVRKSNRSKEEIEQEKQLEIEEQLPKEQEFIVTNAAEHMIENRYLMYVPDQETLQKND